MGELLFYDSNFDKYFTPTEPGWYVQYKTYSGDSGVIKVDRGPKDNDDALSMLNQINPDEIYNINFFAKVGEDGLSIIYDELLYRVKLLETQEQTTVIKGRIDELNHIIVRVQELILNKV